MCLQRGSEWRYGFVWAADARQLSKTHTRRGTHAALFPWACITSEECLQREFCVLTELYEIAWFTHKPPLIYTHRVSAFIAKSWASHYKARLAREAGLLGGHKAPSVTQTVAVSGY